MKATCILSLIILIFIGLCFGAFALSGFNLLLFFCFYNVIAYRIALAAGGAASAWLIFWAVAFKPFDNVR